MTDREFRYAVLEILSDLASPYEGNRESAQLQVMRLREALDRQTAAETVECAK